MAFMVERVALGQGFLCILRFSPVSIIAPFLRTYFHLHTMGNHAERNDSPRSCRDALSKKCYRIHKTGQNKKQRHKTRARDLWNTRRETQIQTKLDQPPRKNGQHQTPEIRPHLKPRGRRDREHPRKRWQRVDARTGQTI